MKYDRCEHVVDTLNMYRALDRSYKTLADKSGIDPDDVRFDGFDGNNETDLLDFAEFLQAQGRFQESLKRNHELNSHAHRETQYNRMLERFRKIAEEHDVSTQWDLSRDEIKRIVAIP